ncbi:transporter substrate-binding domain-containing protein [Ovoidimarina sediminis]|uniref:transporter substrate-binding domain-containing protein n=1 Tax=Ovoidimarina sediminis TaxID=3079856 RepID=UPI0029112579|nr:transporter substrate-binding domain-containing protein [Rhodophyticola sp. MJ-SS7]MDU8945423.1 transporter substrate-binding domain-containing protein [Rhodophyticola sp. MJ-SS7]
MTHPLASIAPNGILRAAINTGNRALVQTEGDRLTGVSPALAHRLADRIGATLEPIIYSGAGKVFADAESGNWSVAFLAIDATRARNVSFTRPYHTIEATFAARADAPFRDTGDADRPGVTILTSTGSAYDMHLSANLQAATLEHSGTPGESFDEFKSGRADLVAGVRASLERHFGGDPGFRILPGVLTKVEQAMVLPGPANPLISALDDFVAEAIEDGFVARALVGG